MLYLIMPIVLLMVIKKTIAMLLQKNTIAIYPAEDGGDIQGIIKT
jgi:hypothetical protein